VLYEGSDKIEMFLQNKPLCAAWNGGNAVQGLVNINSTNFDIVNDPILLQPRNSPLQWTAVNEGWEFLPNNPATSYTINQITYGSQYSTVTILTTTPIYGCTDPTATNYDLSATCDDGSCIATVIGCTNPTSFNYNALANTDDGSCVPFIYGCMDITQFNYNPSANTDDGSCTPFVYGCTNPTSFNYNAAANTDDGSCIAVVLGCIDPLAFNYNAAANTDDGSCIAVVNGCTDATAFNYNAAANTDDGSCIPFTGGCTNPLAANYNAVANTDDGSCVFLGCTNPTSFNYNAAANTDDGSCIAVVLGCIDPLAFNYNAAANTDDGSCTAFVYGCTNPTSFNYNALANNDDGSCFAGCMDSLACNYNALANTDDGNCAYPTTSTTTVSACDSYTCNGTTYAASGTYFISFSTSGTVSLLSYCPSNPAPSLNNQLATIIANVQLTGDNFNISNNTAGVNDFYQNYTSTMYADITEGQSYSVNITPGNMGAAGYNPQAVNVYIDFNIDGDFTDAGEDLGVINIPWGTWVPGTVYPFTVTVPSTGVYGATRMRVVCMSNFNNPGNPVTMGP
jgi:hypothetical protein